MRTIHHLVVQLRKAVTTETLAPIVPQDLEGHVVEEPNERDGPGPQGVGPHRGRSAVMSVDELLRKAEHPRVSRAIARFRAEGISQDQAVAKALAMERDGRLTDEGEYVPMEKGTRYWTKDGQERRGTPIAYGAQGASIVDHQTGYAERVEHGHYVHDAKDEREPWEAMAKSHLQLGPRSGKALLALATLAVEQGCEDPWTHRPAIQGNRVTIGSAKIDDPIAAATARAMVATQKTDRDLWTWREAGQKRKLDGPALNAYRARIGAIPEPERALPSKSKTQLSRAPRPPVATGGGGGARLPTISPRALMRKAELDAQIPRLTSKAAGIPIRSWDHGGYHLELRRKARFAILTIMHKALALPFHLLVRSEEDAIGKARATIEAFDAGRTPPEGIYRALES